MNESNILLYNNLLEPSSQSDHRSVSEIIGNDNQRICAICKDTSKIVDGRPIKLIGRWIRFFNVLKYHPDSEHKDKVGLRDWICFHCYVSERSKAPDYRKNVMKKYYEKVRIQRISSKINNCQSRLCQEQIKKVIIPNHMLYEKYDRCSECKTLWDKDMFIRCPCCKLILRKKARINRKGEKKAY